MIVRSISNCGGDGVVSLEYSKGKVRQCTVQLSVHSTQYTVHRAGLWQAEGRECWPSSVWSQPVPWQQSVTETCNTSWHRIRDREAESLLHICEHGRHRGIIGVLSPQVWGGSSQPSEASYESGDYLWPSQCLESGTTLRPVPWPQPGTSFTWTLLSLRRMRETIRAQKQRKILPVWQK